MVDLNPFFEKAMFSVTDSTIYRGSQLSHQNQMLTAISNQITHSIIITDHSQQIEITHIKFHSHVKGSISRIIVTMAHNYHVETKIMLPANSNHSQQIQITLNKFKSLTGNFKLLTLLAIFSQLQPAVQDI